MKILVKSLSLIQMFIKNRESCSLIKYWVQRNILIKNKAHIIIPLSWTKFLHCCTADFQLLNGNADCNDSTNNKLQINALVPIMLPIHHLYSGQNKTATLSTRSLKWKIDNIHYYSVTFCLILKIRKIPSIYL